MQNKEPQPSRLSLEQKPLNTQNNEGNTAWDQLNTHLESRHKNAKIRTPNLPKSANSSAIAPKVAFGAFISLLMVPLLIEWLMLSKHVPTKQKVNSAPVRIDDLDWGLDRQPDSSQTILKQQQPIQSQKSETKSEYDIALERALKTDKKFRKKWEHFQQRFLLTQAMKQQPPKRPAIPGYDEPKHPGRISSKHSSSDSTWQDPHPFGEPF